jgi:sensor histidine kinase regulating citrate/malate metabolism
MEVFIYIGIFVSFKIITDKYALREEKIKSEAQQTLLESELSSYDEFLQSARQSRHDLRHHNSVVLEYLTSGNIKEAEEYLEHQINDLSQWALETYCEHPTSNAVFRLYARKARNLGISFGVQADIPKQLPLSDTEMGSMLSNILENALHACENRKSNDMFIKFLAERDNYKLKIEMQNSVFCETIFDENSMPYSQKANSGIGTLSVSSTVKRHGGMVSFSQEKNIFITRIVLPLK